MFTGEGTDILAGAGVAVRLLAWHGIVGEDMYRSGFGGWGTLPEVQFNITLYKGNTSGTLRATRQLAGPRLPDKPASRKFV